jgi:hypothetical protein
VPVFCSKTRKMFLKNVGSSRRGAETTVFVVNRYQFYWVSSDQVDLMTSSALDLSCGNLSLYCWQRALMCIVVELSFVMLLAADMTGACDTKLTLFISRLEILLPFYVLLPRYTSAILLSVHVVVSAVVLQPRRYKCTSACSWQHFTVIVLTGNLSANNTLKI